MDFRGFLRPCEAMRQVKKQQIKVKFWIWGPRTVYYNMTFAQNYFQKSLHPTEMLFSYTKYIVYLQKITVRQGCKVARKPIYVRL